MSFHTLLVSTLLVCLPAAAAEQAFDVVVYGGTAGGAIAAVTAAREGLKTALLEPGSHIGGMVSGGLSWTDYGKKEVIGGLALEFYLRVGRHYGLPRYGQDIGWLHEPHVAEDIFREMLKEAGVRLFERHRLAEKKGVRKKAAEVAAITTENGDSFSARVFIDSSYEGDLMAQAGVSYTFGREGSAQYGESLAGVRDRTPLHQFLVDVSPRDAAGRLLPEISSRALPPPGTADKAVQAYNYRMCFSEVAENRVVFAKPKGYAASRYELFARLLAARVKAEGKAPMLTSVIKVDRIPNGKADINNQGAFSTDYIGGSWDYPDATYQRRAEMWREHKDYVQGFFYFLANDPQVPQPLREEMNQWGLCKDEFRDTDNWPHQLYIRESRRMTGEYVMVQKDMQTELTKPDPIGMGSYNSDSHNVERIVGPDGFARNEGDMQVAVKPYQIPYRIMLPKRSEVTNLLVPVAFSASHVAYSSVRMEPQYMILGQAAGVAAKMAIASGQPVQRIDSASLVQKLKEQGAVTEYVPSAQATAIQLFQKRFPRRPPR
ncbi:MAG TPA: FAD-dependent oxidoreductase [Bryobacteraceae bacterium]|nr:FAD-dependent oxidoreductase [Bryobacteraceae bacterium]